MSIKAGYLEIRQLKSWCSCSIVRWISSNLCDYYPRHRVFQWNLESEDILHSRILMIIWWQEQKHCKTKILWFYGLGIFIRIWQGKWGVVLVADRGIRIQTSFIIPLICSSSKRISQWKLSWATATCKAMWGTCWGRYTWPQGIVNKLIGKLWSEHLIIC